MHSLCLCVTSEEEHKQNEKQWIKVNGKRGKKDEGRILPRTHMLSTAYASNNSTSLSRVMVVGYFLNVPLPHPPVAPPLTVTLSHFYTRFWFPLKVESIFFALFSLSLILPFSKLSLAFFSLLTLVISVNFPSFSLHLSKVHQSLVSGKELQTFEFEKRLNRSKYKGKYTNNQLFFTVEDPFHFILL